MRDCYIVETVITIYSTPDSFTEKYAKENNVPFVAE